MDVAITTPSPHNIGEVIKADRVITLQIIKVVIIPDLGEADIVTTLQWIIEPTTQGMMAAQILGTTIVRPTISEVIPPPSLDTIIPYTNPNELLKNPNKGLFQGKLNSKQMLTKMLLTKN